MRQVESPDRRLRLAFIGNPGHVLVRRWATFFARRGHVVTVLEGFGNGDAHELDASIRVVRYDARGRIRLPFASAVHARRTLRRLLSEIEPDVVHAHTVRPYGWQAGVAGRHPYVISTWGSDVLLPLPGRRARFWQRRTLRHADLVTAVSAHMRDAAIRHGARPERVVQVQFGVDTERYRPAPVNASVLDGLGVTTGPFVFSPRAVKPLYNHATILRAFAELRGSPRLVMTARNSEPGHLEALVAQMTELGVRDRVHVVRDASDDEMLALYQAARVVVSAPLSDSFPLTLLEAMSCGTPVVAGDLPPVRGVLEPIAPESIVPTEDPDAMRDALQRVLDLAPDDRRRAGDRLRRIAVETGDHETNMLLMEEHYLGLASRR